ncbi:MAG: CHAT domain-containing protein [Propionibacteriaceae bacterium]
MSPPDADLVGAARTALELVQVDPGQAAHDAERLRITALAQGELVAASVAERALGLAAAHLLNHRNSVAHLVRAVDLAQRVGATEYVGEARMTLAGVLNQRGDSDHALREIETAVGEVTGVRRGRALAQRGAIHQQLGHIDAALLDYRDAWPVLAAADDLTWMQRLLMNRGLAHAFRHDHTAAARDLLAAKSICDDLGLELASAFVAENLVLVHRRMGDVPTALDYLDQATKAYRKLGASLGSLMVERGELLMSVRLNAEAREAAELAVAEYGRTQPGLGRPKARLLLARTVLFSDPDLAGREATRAVRELTAQGRSSWASLARYTALVSRLLSPTRTNPSVPRLVAMANELSDAGWGTTVDDARLIAGRRGLGTRHAELAHAQLQLLSQQRHRGPAERRVRGWLATALLADDAGQPARAVAAAAAGLRTIEDHRATMAATDLRARISGLGTDLAGIGLRHAADRRRPWSMLMWAERGRARHLGERPATPPEDPQLAELLSQLRVVVHERTQQQRSGNAPSSGSLERRQIHLENAIRDLTRRQRADGHPTTTSAPVTREALEAGLDDAALVELVLLDGGLHAVCFAAGRAKHYELGPMAPIAEQVEWLPFALRRLARSGVDQRGRASARQLIARSAGLLDDALLRPLRRQLGERRLVVVPTGALQSLPWGILPGTQGRPVTVAPTARLWLTAANRRPPLGPVTAAAGPGLPGAELEVRAVAELWRVPGLYGATASVGAVSRGLDGAGLAHLAAHGAVRADNPQFSALTFADGPLTVYDVERLRRGPDTVVLAACEAGRSVVLAGDELLGLASAFLAQDTRHLVASTAPLPDVETKPMMVALHRRLAAGSPVADALAATQLEFAGADDRLWAAAAGFVCLGHGLSPAAIAPRQTLPRRTATGPPPSPGPAPQVRNGPSVAVVGSLA